MQCNHKKHDNPIHIKSIALLHVDMHYQGFQRIYTDGSKEPTTSKTGAAIYDSSGPFEEGCRCTDNISVYSTEIIVLIAALKHIHNKGYQRTAVLSDSLSALQTLQTYPKPVDPTYSTQSSSSYINPHNATNIYNSSGYLHMSAFKATRLLTTLQNKH
jgi:ribonuclease HI